MIIIGNQCNRLIKIIIAQSRVVIALLRVVIALAELYSLRIFLDNKDLEKILISLLLMQRTPMRQYFKRIVSKQNV